MSDFEDNLERMWKWDTVTDEAAAIRVVAQGLAEVIALLRPLVDTVTARPEPLEVRSQNVPMPCLAGDPGSGGFRRCTEAYGHEGDHRHESRLSSVTHVWPQQAAPKAQCTSTLTPSMHSEGDHVLRCELDQGHDGLHTDGTENERGPMIWGTA